MSKAQRPTLYPAVIGAFILVLACSEGGNSPNPKVKDPPTGLTYATNPAKYTLGSVILPNAPTCGGGPVATYSVTPSLPPGLALTSTTGLIVGTPTALAVAATYTVTAANAAGSSTALLEITVTDVAPSGLAYSSNPASYSWDTAIPTNMPSSSGGAVVSYSVSPSLPPGLSIDPATGAITGLPAEVGSGSYTVTASNSGGSSTVVLQVGVAPLVWTSISAGTWSGCGMGANGAAYCWGTGAALLGDGTTSTTFSRPTRVARSVSLDQIVVADHVCGLASGSAHCWGGNDLGQTGGSDLVRTTPLAIMPAYTFAKVAAGRSQSCAITTGGALYCWGSSFGALGQPSNAVAGSYVDVASSQDVACAVDVDGALHCWGADASYVSGFSGVALRKVNVTFRNACGIGADDRAYCWGDAVNCYLGAGGSGGKLALPGDPEVLEVQTGCWVSCALDATGKVYCWGRNTYGGLGLGPDDTLIKTTPTLVPGLPVMAQLSVSASEQVCGLDSNGGRWCWGSALSGQLGDGTTTGSVSSPKLIP